MLSPKVLAIAMAQPIEGLQFNVRKNSNVLVNISISCECEEINAKYIFDEKTKVFLLTIIVASMGEERVFFQYLHYFFFMCQYFITLL